MWIVHLCVIHIYFYSVIVFNVAIYLATLVTPAELLNTHKCVPLLQAGYCNTAVE